MRRRTLYLCGVVQFHNANISKIRYNASCFR
nr:MAG TPA: hypothetical protein [Caudoviricetes sp.]